MREVYGLDLGAVMGERSVPLDEIAGHVQWLPAGCAFWRSVGGPAAISDEVRALRSVSYWLRVLEYRERGSKGEKPKMESDPEWAHERAAKEEAGDKKAEAYLRRQRRLEASS